jgi:F-type H+-transporting ATPase subunit a
VENKQRFFGIPNRYLILVLVVISIIVFYVMDVKPIMPHVQLPAEQFSEDGFLTNTLVATFLVDIILIALAFTVKRSLSGDSLVPKGMAGAIEALLEAILNLTESTAGKWTKAIFPWFATITLLVLIANWMELIPGVDSIGIINPHHVENFEEICQVSHFGPIAWLAPSPDADEAANECARAFIPYVRVVSTDLNFTAALAVISVVMTQVFGVRALGPGYFKKFWNTSTLFSVPVFGLIDFAVGLLEIVSELAKILSFSFRLFGNIFAGSVLLFVMGSLVPVVVQSGFLMLEFFVGLIQAIVFGMLTMVFMAQATQSHHGDAEEHEEHA